jgi:hypothetical protein
MERINYQEIKFRSHMGVCEALFWSVPDIGSGAGGQGGCSSVCRFMFAWL